MMDPWLYPDFKKVHAMMKDPEWAEKPLWMLNVLDLHVNQKYEEYTNYMENVALPEIGGRIVFKGLTMRAMLSNKYRLAPLKLKTDSQVTSEPHCGL